MTPLVLVGIAALLIFLIGFMAGQGVETRTSMTRSNRLAARQRQLNEQCRALRDPQANELHLVAVARPMTRYAYVTGDEEDD